MRSTLEGVRSLRRCLQYISSGTRAPSPIPPHSSATSIHTSTCTHKSTCTHTSTHTSTSTSTNTRTHTSRNTSTHTSTNSNSPTSQPHSGCPLFNDPASQPTINTTTNHTYGRCLCSWLGLFDRIGNDKLLVHYSGLSYIHSFSHWP